MKLFKGAVRKTLIYFDLVFSIFAVFGYMGVVARRAMASSTKGLPLTRFIFSRFGYLPIRDHYYEPLTFGAEGFKYRKKVSEILFFEQKDFTFLSSIAKQAEFIKEYEQGFIKEAKFKFGNGSFESGDAETLYYFVRGLKPKKIIEIGAGNSSLVIHAALKSNQAEGCNGQHIIIEPYENPWLEKLEVRVIRERVEKVEFSIFQELEAGDIVFIDSSHVVRAQNDCVFEYTELLPNLPSGVVVHIHDIFTPFDYPEDWINKTFHLWTEQYILEALLTNADTWEILAPLCWLSRDTEQFKLLCPYFEAGRIPGSMWIRKL